MHRHEYTTRSSQGGHPIERVMNIAMTKLKDLVDTDTIVGSAMTAPDGTVIIPVSKVAMGFLTGGGEYDSAKDAAEFPFAGGSGAGLSVTPIGFLIGREGEYEMVTAGQTSLYERLLAMLPKFAAALEREDEQD